MSTKNVNESDGSDLSPEDEYQVERIAKVRIRGGQKEYFLKWKGYSEDENTWEPASHLDCAQLIKEFEDNMKKERPSAGSPVSSSKSSNSVSRKRTTPTISPKISPNMSKKAKRSRPVTPKVEENNLTPVSKKSTEPPRSIRPVRGFGRGFNPDRIIGATDSCGELMFLIKWKECSEADLVPAREANIKCPQIVIRFYEERLTWHTPEASTGSAQNNHSTTAVVATSSDVEAPHNTNSLPHSAVVSSSPLVATQPPVVSNTTLKAVTQSHAVVSKPSLHISSPSDADAINHTVVVTPSLTVVQPSNNGIQTHTILAAPTVVAASFAFAAGTHTVKEAQPVGSASLFHSAVAAPPTEASAQPHTVLDKEPLVETSLSAVISPPLEDSVMTPTMVDLSSVVTAPTLAVPAKSSEISSLSQDSSVTPSSSVNFEQPEVTSSLHTGVLPQPEVSALVPSGYALQSVTDSSPVEESIIITP